MDHAAPARFMLVAKAGRGMSVDALGLRAPHRDAAVAVAGRDGTKAHVAADAAFAVKHRPDLAIATGAVGTPHADVAANPAHLLHPHLPDVTLRPWGARGSAPRDRTGICDVPRQSD